VRSIDDLATPIVEPPAAEKCWVSGDLRAATENPDGALQLCNGRNDTLEPNWINARHHDI